MTAGTLDPRNRTFIHDLAERLGLEFESLDERLPEKPISDFEGVADQRIRILEESETEGNIRLTELIAINKFVRYKNPERVFEFGTFDGRTTLNLAGNTGDDSEVYTIDLPPDQKPETDLNTERGDDYFIEKSRKQSYRYQDYPESEKIYQIHSDSAQYDYDQLGNNFDFIFVDGAHSYEYVKSDTKIALELINEEGLILWHDYGTFKGVTDALNEYWSDNEKFASLTRIKNTSLVVLDLTHRGLD
jgi:predicted O-methyltransferase YrrM